MNTRVLAALLLLSLSLLAAGPAARARTEMRTIHQARRHEYDTKSTYPVLLGGSPLASLADRTLSLWVGTQQRQFVAQAGQDYAQGDAAQYAPDGYGYEVSPAYQYSPTPRLFSVGLEKFEYDGGAHPDTDRFTFNFGLVAGRPKRLTLGDFFRPGSDYRVRVQKALFAKLRQDSRAEFLGEIVAFTPEQLNRFLVEPDGLRFCFNPYEVGSYADGPVDVMLTPADLGPDFRRALLAGR